MDKGACFFLHSVGKIIGHGLNQTLVCQHGRCGKKARLNKVDLLIGCCHKRKLCHHFTDGNRHKMYSYAYFGNTDLVDCVFNFLKIHIVKSVCDDLHVHVISILGVYAHRSCQKADAHDTCH